MAEEVELKLALSPAELLRLRRNPLVRSLSGSRLRTKRLQSTYYDTPERTLKRKGMALRVRRVGKQWVQSLKLPADKPSSTIRHREYEVRVPGGSPEPARFQLDELRAFFAKDDLAAQLEPVFTTDIRRSLLPLKVGDSEMELALDTGEITANGARLPVSEAGVELVSGRPEEIFAFALVLHQHVPFRLEARSKAMRGYGLAARSKPKAVRAEALDLVPEMSVGAAFKRAARNCLAQIRANEPAALSGEDPEGIHQFRVGVRRIRALLSAFKPVMLDHTGSLLKEELCWLQGELGPARDWDVFIDETLKPLHAHLPQEPGPAALVEAAEAAREQAYGKARAAITGRRYTALILRLEMWLESSDGSAGPAAGKMRFREQAVGPFAAQVLERRWCKLERAVRQHRTLRGEELHAVRILAKKLRYPVEFLRALHPKRAVKRHLRDLSALQDTLGSLNDAVVGQGLLDELAQSLSGARAEESVLRDALGLVRGWQAACIKRDLAGFGSAWARLSGAKAYWR